MKAPSDAAIERLLGHQVADVIVRESLEKKLRSGKKLRIKFGADPSRPDLHLGHAVVLRKLREFQDLGHTVIFLIGDFTALIGDPTGKSKTRPMLSSKEIKENAKTYMKQVGKVLNVKKGELRYNSEWLGKMKAADFVSLCAQFTLARITERDDFSKRLAAKTDVYMHELLYPMLQAYDSIALNADVELGATDQTFNLLAGRALMSKKELVPQDILTTPILVGTDGKEKMSKSLGNYIGLTDSAEDMFGKTMSVPDSALPNWLELAVDYSKEEIAAENAALKKGENPRDVKMRLAKRLVSLYHDKKAADKAEEGFKARFQKGEMPTEMKSWKLPKPMKLYEIVASAFAMSNSQARRDIESGGVKIDGAAVKNPMQEIAKGGVVLQKGKLHFVKIV
ncbi:MAG: tyrosine--tRNA ligase [Patescibacteria group bacterium]|jgi:tyrosyl-tRNA synthetase